MTTKKKKSATTTDHATTTDRDVGITEVAAILQCGYYTARTAMTKGVMGATKFIAYGSKQQLTVKESKVRAFKASGASK